MTNEKIRGYAKKRGVRLWEVAKSIGVSEATFSRKLRYALSKDEASMIISTIDSIAAKRAKP